MTLTTLTPSYYLILSPSAIDAFQIISFEVHACFIAQEVDQSLGHTLQIPSQRCTLELSKKYIRRCFDNPCKHVYLRPSHSSRYNF